MDEMTGAEALLSVSRCALAAWRRGSPLTLAAADSSSRSVGDRLDSLGYPLEERYAPGKANEGDGGNGSLGFRRHCSGLCVDLSASVGMRVSDAAPMHCLCRFIELFSSVWGDNALPFAEEDYPGGVLLRPDCSNFCDECAQFLFDCSLPLQTRCIILSCLCPLDDADCEGTATETSGFSTVSTLCNILNESPSSAQSDVAKAAVLAGIPLLVRSLAHRWATNTKRAQDDNAQGRTAVQVRAASTYIVGLLGRHDLLKCVVGHASPAAANEGAQLRRPASLQRLAYVCLRLLLGLYHSASAALSVLGRGGSLEPESLHAGVLLRASPVSASSLVLTLASTVALCDKWPRNLAELDVLSHDDDEHLPPKSTKTIFDLFVSPALQAGQKDGTNEICSPHVRFARWEFLAAACHRCSLSELREWNVRKPLQEKTSKEKSPAAENNDDPAAVDADTRPASSPSCAAMWLLSVPFIDPDRLLREHAARCLGSFLLGRRSRIFFALFLTDGKWKDWISRNGDVGDGDAAVTRLFREIDRLLYKHCDVNQSQLSYTAAFATESTAGTLSSTAGTSPTERKVVALSHRATAVRALGSICEHADLTLSHGTKVYERSLLRLIRLWIQPASGDTVPACGGVLTDLSSLAFAEFRRLDARRPFSVVFQGVCRDSFVPALFSEILFPGGGGGDGNSSERQFRFLMSFIHSFLSRGRPGVGHLDRGIRHSVSMNEMLDYVNSVYPIIIPVLIIEQDYEALRMCAGFRLYLFGQYEDLHKAEKKMESVGIDDLVGQLKRKKRSNIPGVGTSTAKLNDHTKRLCNSPDIIEQVLPRLLLHPDRAPLVFFLRTVNQSELNLRQLLLTRENSVLRYLLWESGKAEHDILDEKSEDTFWIVQALKKGAILREQEEEKKAKPKEISKPSELKRSHTLDAIDAMNKDAATRTGHDAAMRWVSSNFIMLHVNLVSQKWKVPDDIEKIRALRCLRTMLQFLDAGDSPQFLTHVLSTVNQCFTSTSTRPLTASVARMKFLAVQIVSKYVQVLLMNEEVGVKTVGENLSSIVVSLFPVLDSKEGSIEYKDCTRDDEECIKSYSSRSLVHAVSFMELLVNDSIGRQLAAYFADIPFLPPNPELDSVRSSLRSMGIDFDNLLVITQIDTQNSQQGSAGRESLASTDGESENKKCRSRVSSQAQAALQGRLLVLRNLVSHENASVRVVVLKHLADLLRANRNLFHRLIESEDAASMRFLTVVHEDVNAPDVPRSRTQLSLDDTRADYSVTSGGVVTSVVQSLLARCVVETNAEARLAISIALGEIGAIDANRLCGQVDSALSAALTTDSFEASGRHGMWRISQPPWNSQIIRYELQLVTKHLVVALKAAPTTLDQHKVAYTIQELLALLASQASSSNEAVSGPVSDRRDKEKPFKMNPWLSGKLEEAGVLEVVEPFWSTSYHQSDKVAPKKPPFFRRCFTYSTWLSNWCRFMINRSKENDRSRWREFFFACRSAVRSASGVRVAEFLLPLLVLDNITFGDSTDEIVITQELRDALSSGGTDRHMPKSEGQKVVNAVFMVMDTLQIWNERETEDRHRVARGGSPATSRQKASLSETSQTGGGMQLPWPADDSIACIDDLLKALPLLLCAGAAAKVGMHARSLRFLELQARSHFVSLYDETHGEVGKDAAIEVNFGHQRKLRSIDLGLAQNVLGCLSDFDTMSAVSQERQGLSRNLADHIKEREALNDWAGALQSYEQALQIRERAKSEETMSAKPGGTHALERGMINCLLEMGQLESVLNQVKGILHGSQPTEESTSKQHYNFLLPSAVEAAWRLGDWFTLEQLVDDAADGCGELDADGAYHISLGRAMFGLHQQSRERTLPSLTEARKAVLTSLAGAARESYSRVYPYLLRLHCLQELEDAAGVLCPRSAKSRDLSRGCGAAQSFADLISSDSAQGWEWEGRLQMTASEVVGSNAIVNARLSLCHIAGLPDLEGSVWLDAGKRARKSGLHSISENFLAHANAAYDRLKQSSSDIADHWQGSKSLRDDVRMQLAKLRHVTGKTSVALRLLDQERIQGLLNKEGEDLKKMVVSILKPDREGGDESADGGFSDSVKYLAKEVLQGTEWMVEGGLKSGAEVVSRYNLVKELRQIGGEAWERAHFLFARYLDSLLEARIMALSGHLGKEQHQIMDEDAVRAHMLKRDPNCQKYLLQCMEEYGKALQLGQKHVFRALPRLLTLWFDFTAIPNELAAGPNQDDQMLKKEVASLVSQKRKANGQMIELYKVVPAVSFYTALPQLISRVSHRDEDTARIVRAILSQVLQKFPAQAMWALAWLRHSVHSDRVKIGESIFHNAQKSLRRKEDMKMHDLLVASKSLFIFLISLAKHQPKNNQRTISIKAWRGEVELMEFVPPVQAALSISPSTAGLASSREAFPAFVPRMRNFSSNVFLMASKARPKKLTAFAVPAGQKPRRIASGKQKGQPQPGDIGEMHFLVKQEAKGDLRKDARVQDLNNVINRLLAGGGVNSNARRQRRRLHLRTFSVVCLSEDCGLLEWVPNTDSLRNIVSSSYNPQASPHSIRRRGKRIANFGDISLRNTFEKSQNMYFKNGQLSRAAELFEETCLRQYPPVLYWWFVKEFLDPHAWFEARTAFTLSAAAWSAVGHVIGLGDRHSENILIDTKTGDCVHVDFDCIFDKGLHLPRPEVVPFRLTQNMLDAFGPVGAEGAFTGGLTTAMSALRENRDTLLSVLEPFLKDPVIDWKRHRVQQKQGKTGLPNQESKEAKRSIKAIDGRLKGVYNLRNPNLVKYRRTDTIEQDDETTHILPLSVEGQVQKMISEATSNENLVQLYVGWMPWL